MKRRTTINTIVAASMALTWLTAMAACNSRHDDHYYARERDDRREVQPVVVHEVVVQEARPVEQPLIRVDVHP